MAVAKSNSAAQNNLDKIKASKTSPILSNTPTSVVPQMQSPNLMGPPAPNYFNNNNKLAYQVPQPNLNEYAPPNVIHTPPPPPHYPKPIIPPVPPKPQMKIKPDKSKDIGRNKK